MNDIDWKRSLGDVLQAGGDIVNVVQVIGQLSHSRSDQYVGANALREQCALSVAQTIEILAWLAGERTADELRTVITW